MDAHHETGRQRVVAHVADAYGIEPDWPWGGTYADSCVLRHPDNRKWFGLLMTVRRNLLGLEAADASDEAEVDILNVKCDPDMAAIAHGAVGILPAYHMNKDSWVSILLDGSIPDEMVFDLLDRSFELTKARPRRTRSGR